MNMNMSVIHFICISSTSQLKVTIKGHTLDQVAQDDTGEN